MAGLQSSATKSAIVQVQAQIGSLTKLKVTFFFVFLKTIYLIAVLITSLVLQIKVGVVEVFLHHEGLR